MNPARFFIDVNVPMYAAGTEHAMKAASVWVMRQAADGLLDVAVDTETIQEVLHRYSALGRPQTGIIMAMNLLDIVPAIYPITVADIRLTIELFERNAPQGVTARDALHVAVMLHNGLTHIISADQHFDSVAGITRFGIGDLAQTKMEIEGLKS